MGCYFVVIVNIEDKTKKVLYDEYIEKVKPVVESYGGKYLVRSENIESLFCSWRPERIIIIRFGSRKDLDRCFSSKEYNSIKALREESVDAKAVIVEGI